MAYQKISDREAFVKEKLGNRSDLDGRIRTWLRDSYLEFAFAYPFDELLSTTETSTTAGTDTYDYPVGVRGLRALTLIDSNKQGIPLERRNIRYLDGLSAVAKGRPWVYAPWVVQGVGSITRFITLRNVPDKSYTLRWRTWLSAVIGGDIKTTDLHVPDDWLEIVDYGAALRGFSELLEHDRAQAIRDLLYGFIDPTSGKKQPGLIASRMTTMQAEYAAGIFPVGELSQKYGHG